jgi:pimeloyl-ACP methyl ester carboxylesterase
VVHTLNFSGHSGEPFPEHFGIEAFANDILNYIKSHSLAKPDIFGYSMGGYVALWLAHLHPGSVGKVITLGTKYDWSRASAEKETKKIDPDKIEEKVPAFARILQQRHAPNDWKVLLYKTAAMMMALGDRPLLDKEVLQCVEHEVLILLGSLDDMADRAYSEQVAAWLPKGKFALLQNTPHPIERADLKVLAKILGEVFQ